MAPLHHFTRVDFSHFKAFKDFTLHLRNFNILVGPNNAGKSTILTAFRILAAAMRRANTRNPELVQGPNGRTYGHVVELKSIAVAEENIFYNYDESEPANILFRLSNGNELLLFFPEVGACNLIPIPKSASVNNTKKFKAEYNCPIGFVPILGPVEHVELLYEKEAARLALYNYQAARNFRNIWHHYSEKFDDFRSALAQTWPGMDIEQPTMDLSHEKARLHMFCKEGRILREIFWSGFGFQVWCQMLTHVIQSKDRALFLIDEPDIYLHSDLQRQLLSILKNLGPDILIATHSTEIITEADPDDIVLVNKDRRYAKRVKHPGQLETVFQALGSNLNPILTQLAKTKRALFVEGKDFQVISKFARKLGFVDVANRTNFAVIPVDGFNPERAKNLRDGMELTLGGRIESAIIFDRDYRSSAECAEISGACAKFCSVVVLHKRKEIENFLLVPAAIDRAARERVAERANRSGKRGALYQAGAQSELDKFALDKRSYVTALHLACRRRFERVHSPGTSEDVINELVLREIDGIWQNPERRLQLVPGKEAFGAINEFLQSKYSVHVTAAAVVDAMTEEEIPEDMKNLVERLAQFAVSSVQTELEVDEE